jgi:hypothetical protein
MVHPTAAARLVAPAGGALSLMTDLPRTAAGTVNLAAVAAAADEYLRLAANAQEQPGWPFRRLRQAAAWTPSATGGIMSRHACSAPCGARRRTRAWQFRSAPCLPIGRLSSRHCALETRHSAATERAAQAGLWICGQRTRGVAHIPTGAANDSQHQVDCFEGRPLRPYPSPAGDYQPKRSDQLAQATAPSLRGSGQPSTDGLIHHDRARFASIGAAISWTLAASRGQQDRAFETLPSECFWQIAAVPLPVWRRT